MNINILWHEIKYWRKLIQSPEGFKTFNSWQLDLWYKIVNSIKSLRINAGQFTSLEYNFLIESKWESRLSYIKFRRPHVVRTYESNTSYRRVPMQSKFISTRFWSHVVMLSPFSVLRSSTQFITAISRSKREFSNSHPSSFLRVRSWSRLHHHTKLRGSLSSALWFNLVSVCFY